ncbi:class I SAM-dependent methyltransferase [Mycobacterium sp. MYCO198283]|uniref:class I SAM-dependent methyltransferase n=1 Tax=Mycobacterium sp. MYCO198283 TaxID=2883505 RepID=UPI001E5D52FB|nr:class I SAM-dependent methyltransferase [Mycobacterium sp. MYCO198283]MCG5431790.1 class I SAM-dependent methyltransferase [Mycobacterium sp. MYCO198283]
MLVSPATGEPLRSDTPHSLADGAGGRWPVVDGIPYLRGGRDDLVATALAHLDAGRSDDALVALLADQDDWWTGPTAEPAALRRLVAERASLTLREALALLQLGPVADYFTYRWGDPTYLGALALLQAHWQAPDTAFELACGIGHFVRELSRRGVRCTGADVVFAKCWVARHWVAPDADYLVFDAALRWPIGDARFDLVQCHDAFYFLPRQDEVAARLRDAVAPGGTLAVSHVHNAGYAGGAKGPARSAAEWAALFPAAAVYDERTLLDALLDAGTPQPVGWAEDPAIEAWSLVEPAGPARAVAGGVAEPPADAHLQPHPLLDGDTVRWPSARYREEYATSPWQDVAFDPVRSRRLVDLPERW